MQGEDICVMITDASRAIYDIQSIRETFERNGHPVYNVTPRSFRVCYEDSFYDYYVDHDRIYCREDMRV